MKVHVFGLGAIGSNLLLALVKQFPDFEFVGIDFDRVEDRNIGIQAFFREQVNQPKAKAIQAVAQRYVRKFKYTPRQEKIVGRVERPQDGELFIDCFDNSLSRKYLTMPGVHNILHLGFSPSYTAEFIWNESYDVPGDTDPNAPDICTLHDAIPFIHMFVTRAFSEIVDWVSTGERKNLIMTNKYKVVYL